MATLSPRKQRNYPPATGANMTLVLVARSTAPFSPAPARSILASKVFRKFSVTGGQTQTNAKGDHYGKGPSTGTFCAVQHDNKTKDLKAPVDKPRDGILGWAQTASQDKPGNLISAARINMQAVITERVVDSSKMRYIRGLIWNTIAPRARQR